MCFTEDKTLFSFFTAISRGYNSNELVYLLNINLLCFKTMVQATFKYVIYAYNTCMHRLTINFTYQYIYINSYKILPMGPDL